MYSQKSIDEAQRATILSDLMEKFGVRIKRSPTGKHMGHCFSHDDKRASMSVDDSKGLFCCNAGSCNVGGNCFTFVMEHKGVDFAEAVEIVAEEAGVRLEQQGGHQARAKAVDRLALRDSLDKVQAHFSSALQKSAAGKAYLAKRGLTMEDAERFGIGMAEGRLPEVPHLFDLGLLRKGEDQKVRPLLTNRMTFGIADQTRRLVAFAGRALSDEILPKYINTPESPIFRKGTVLYGASWRPDRDPGPVFLVEGYMDVIACHKAGVTSAEAAMGTAVTEHHLRHIFRRTDTLVIGLDGDKAGQIAANRIIPLALDAAERCADEPRIRLCTLPDNHDPDSYIRANGVDALHKSIAGAVPVDEYLLQECAKYFKDRSRAEARMAVHKRLKAALGESTGPFARAIALTLAEEFRLDPAHLLAPADQLPLVEPKSLAESPMEHRFVAVLLQRSEISRTLRERGFDQSLPRDSLSARVLATFGSGEPIHRGTDIAVSRVAKDADELRLISTLSMADHGVKEADIVPFISQAMVKLSEQAQQQASAPAA